MRLIELRLKNLNSLKGEWHIDFSDAAFLNEGIFAITGQTGAGKTTILDAICLALYSQTPRLGDITGSANEMMTQGTGECSAEVIIEINTKRYQCSWYQHRAHKKAKGNLLPIKHEISDVETGNILEEKKSKTSAFIQNLIGMDFNQFTRSIMLAQGSFAAFLKSDIGDRAAILEKITGTAIYAKISSRVHEKKRFEEEVLGKLQAGVNGLSLLSIEDEDLLSVELKDFNEQQNTQRQAFKTLNEQLQWLDNVHQLQQNLTLYQSELTTAQHAQQVFIPESMRLELAHKALEIDSQFRELSYSRDTVNKLGVEQQQLVSQISMQQKDLEQASIQRASANQKELQASSSLQINLPIIAKTRQLDINIEQQSQSLADDNQRKGILLTNTSKLRQDIETHNQTKQKTKNQLANIASYVSDFPELSDLDGDMAAFDNSCKRFRVLLEDNVSLANSQLDYDHQSKQLNVDFETFHAEQKTDSERVQRQQEQLIDLKQQQACLIQNHSTATMRSKQEQIDHISTQIEQAGFKLERLSELTRQIQRIHQSLPELHKALETLEVLIASHALEIQETKRKKQDKQDHLSLLQRVAKLEDYILELEDGVPCPLCGAYEHPFAKNHPLLDKDTNDNAHQDKLSKTQRTQKQIAELETVIENLNQALSNHNIDFATQKEAIKHQQQQLAPLQQQSKTLYADIQNTLSSLLDAEKPVSESILAIIEPLAQINSDINTTEPNIDRSLSLLNRAKQNLLEQKQSLKTTLSHYDELNDRISKLSSAMESNEKRRQVLMSGINRLTTEMKLNAQKIESVVDKMAANFSELIPIMATISSLVDKYPVVKHQNYLITELSVTDIQSALEQLRSSVYEQKVLSNIDYDRHIDKLRAQRYVLKQLKQHHNEQISQQQQLANTLSSLTAQIDAKQSQLTHDESALNELETLIADKTSAIEQSISDRKEVFADKDPINEENRLRDAADNAKAEAALAQRQSDRAKQTLDQLQARQQQLASECQAVTDTMNNQQSIFMNLLKESQFADETAFINARLSREGREALNRRQQAIENAVRQAKLQLESTQQALAQKLAIPLTQQNRQEIAVQHQQIQTDIDKLNQQIGAIDQKLKDNQRQKGEQAAQLIAIDAQKQKLLVWQQLHTLIGSADGKKYRTFAQGLTFEVMITHANSQLQKMSDRYLLIHDEDHPLELNVIDNYQGGDIRSTKNLSGGEGFIISLALALGLSQMASHNIRVDSLFLDEGFGTLDEESLDIALDTLTSLQQEGKLIGIISHVQALKERILTQIQVKKLSGGFSEISGQGCYKITT